MRHTGVYGASLHGGAHGERRCRIGEEGQPVPASLDETSGALLCFTPPAPRAGTPASLPVYVSLNVDHFTRNQPTFDSGPDTWCTPTPCTLH